MQTLGFNLHLFRRFWVLCRVVLRQRNAKFLLAGLLALAILYEVVAYYVGVMSSKFYVVLGGRDWHGFWNLTATSFAIILAICTVRALRTYVAGTAGLQWRLVLTEDLHKLYFSCKTHYTVNVLEGDLDNPDQRMTQDVDRFCQKIAEALPSALVSPFTTIYYTYQSSKIAGWSGPVSAFGFFLIFTVVNKFLLSPVVPRVYEQEKQEGKFRHVHAKIRAHSESIAFLDGEVVERINTDRQLRSVVHAQQSVINWQLPLSFGVHTFDYLGSILSFLVIAVPIFNGTYDGIPAAELSGVISKNAFVSIYLISCFSSLVDLSSGFSIIAGNTHRIAALRERMLKRVQDDEMQQIEIRETSGEDEDGPSVELVNVSYVSPRNNSALVQGLNFVLDTKHDVLVTGASGTGKTTLLRIIKGLRGASSGDIRRRGMSSVMFMPQVPWLTRGSLRTQICYPSLDKGISGEDEDMENLLEIVGLKHLLENAYSLDAELDLAWYDALSPGEKQRLSWTRILHRKPSLAFLDEPTAAVDDTLRNRLYAECAKRGITVVAVGYKHEVQGWQPGIELTIGSDGRSWNVEFRGDRNR